MRTRVILAAAAAVTALAGGGTAYAMTSAPAPGAQPVSNWVYACVTGTGTLDYLEFRGLLPHACNPGDALWRWPAVIPPKVLPSPSPAS